MEQVNSLISLIIEGTKLLKKVQDTYDFFEKGERHGSYELTWAAPLDVKDIAHGGLQRFVTLAITPLEEESELSIVEIWAGADDNRERFVRQLIAQFSRVRAGEVSESPLRDQILASVQTAAEHARVIKLIDPTGVRPLSGREVEDIKEKVGNPPREETENEK